MRIVIIGGTGHVGTYLVPRLAMAGHEVISVSRQKQRPYQSHSAWGTVKQVTIDRNSAEEEGTFGRQIKELGADVLIDMICFTLKSAKSLVEALQGEISHFLHCGSIWVHGPSEAVPTLETQVRKPFCEYGRQKAEIEDYLLTVSRQRGFPATVLHPGHITGPGWLPVNPAGNLNPDVFRALAKGRIMALPNLGLETLHHVHADDVAQAFEQAIYNRSSSIGESFHVVSEQALTLRGYAMAMASWFGQKAVLDFLPWDAWKQTVGQEEAECTLDHISHSANCSILKAKKLISYAPRYTSLEAIQEAVSKLRLE